MKPNYFMTVVRRGNNITLVEVPSFDMFVALRGVKYQTGTFFLHKKMKEILKKECRNLLKEKGEIPKPLNENKSYLEQHFENADTYEFAVVLPSEKEQDENTNSFSAKWTGIKQYLKKICLNSKEYLKLWVKAKKYNRRVEKEANKNLREMQNIFNQWNKDIDKQVKESQE